MAIKHMPRDFVVRISSDSGLGKSFMKPKGVRIHGCLESCLDSLILFINIRKYVK